MASKAERARAKAEALEQRKAQKADDNDRTEVTDGEGIMMPVADALPQADVIPGDDTRADSGVLPTPDGLPEADSLEVDVPEPDAFVGPDDEQGESESSTADAKNNPDNLAGFRETTRMDRSLLKPDSAPAEPSVLAAESSAPAAEPDELGAADIAIGVAPATSDRVLPALLSEDKGPLAAEVEPVAESVRYLLARPNATTEVDLPTRIAIVAALPGDGVTTISSVYSSVLSYDYGVPTCRVDLSWESTGKPGVFEVAMGTAELDDVLEWDGRVATLHSGGVSGSERSRLARAEELDKLINELTGRFKHVILDLPAILDGSDGLSMMRLADAYVLVVRNGVTTLQQVQSATDELGGFSSLGTVLNHYRTRTPRPLSRWFAG